MPSRRNKQLRQLKAALPSASVARGQMVEAEQLVTKDGQVLCKRCTDIYTFIASKPRTQIGRGFGQFICRLDLSEQCRMCKLLSAMKLPGKPGLGYNLYGFSAWSLFHDDEPRKEGDQFSDSDGMFFGVIPAGKKVRKEYVLNSGHSTGFLATVSNVDSYSGVEIMPTKIDFKLIKEWLSQCRVEHACHKIRGLKGANVAVIDCSTRTIVEAPANCHFIALSYVWGPAVAPELEDPDFKYLTQLPARCANVIEDAILVAKELDYKYLWVDKYCINQADAEVKHNQILNMGFIYKNAAVTILAVSGTDAESGLPGVGRTSRKGQFSIKIKDTVIVSTLPHPVEEVLTSKWNTRGWTFQESYFSRRRLVFTAEQVYLECEKTYFCESIRYPLKVITDYYRQNYKLDWDGARPTPPLHRLSIPSSRQYVTLYGVDGTRYLQKLIEKSKSPNLQSFEYNVLQYSARHLSYDSDALNAFRGILRDTNTILHTWGVPCGYPGYEDQFQSGGAFYKSTLDIGYGMSWTHGTDPEISLPRRRSEYPSWSWLGWKGAVTWLVPSNAYSDFSQHPYREADIRTNWQPHKANKDPPRQLHITGDIINVRFEYLAPSGQDTKSRVKEAGFYIRYDDPVSYQPTRLHLTQDPTHCPKLEERLLTESWTAIILGRSVDIHIYYILIVGIPKIGDLEFERIGICQALDGWVLAQQAPKQTIVLG
jgi:hypothetical protein